MIRNPDMISSGGENEDCSLFSSVSDRARRVTSVGDRH